VVFTDLVQLRAALVRTDTLLDEVADRLSVRGRSIAIFVSDVTERVDAENEGKRAAFRRAHVAAPR
jgi:hypothetical protein